MNIQEINYIIREVLNGNRIVSYLEFENVIKLFGLYNMSFVDDAKFIITDELSLFVLGRCCGIEWIKINKKVIKKIYFGDKFSMLAIFHELKHFKDNYNIFNDIYDEDTVLILKEELINEANNEFSNNLFGEHDLFDSDNYYLSNYEKCSQEILADRYGYIEMLRYFKEIGVNLTSGEVNCIECEIKKLDKKLSNKIRNFKDCLMFNSYYLSVDEAFDFVVLDNPKWLEDFPCLRKEYYVDSKNKVRKLGVSSR